MKLRWRVLSFRHHRWQSALAVAALATAVALPVILLSVGNGVVTHEENSLTNSGYQIVVSAPTTHGIGSAHNFTHEVLAVPQVAAASPILSVPLELFTQGTLCAPALSEGVIPGQFAATEGSLEEGLFPPHLNLGDPTDLVHFAGGTYSGPATWSVLVSSPLAQSCAVTVGSPVFLALSSTGHAGVMFNVTGTFGVPPSALGPAAAFALVLPLSDLQVIAGLARSSTGFLLDSADTVQVALAGSAAIDPSAIESVAKTIQTDIGPYYTTSTLLQQAQQLESGSAVLNGFYLALSSVALAVGLVFLAIVQVRRVETEHRSIGIRRALGLPPRAIAWEMARHALVLSGIGVVAGVAGGIVVVEWLAAFGTSTVQTAARLAVYSPILLGSVVAGVVGLSLLSSLAATQSALRLSIPEALR